MHVLASVTRFGEISPTLTKYKGIWLFFGVTYAVFGKILNLLWQKYTFGQIQIDVGLKNVF